MKLFFASLLISVSLFCSAQKGDTITSSKPDTVQVIMNEFLTFLQDKITVKEYMPVQQMVNAFIMNREANKKKKK